jgi:hypothetical protein
MIMAGFNPISVLTNLGNQVVSAVENIPTAVQQAVGAAAAHIAPAVQSPVQMPAATIQPVQNLPAPFISTPIQTVQPPVQNLPAPFISTPVNLYNAPISSLPSTPIIGVGSVATIGSNPVADIFGTGGIDLGLGETIASNPIGWGVGLGLGGVYALKELGILDTVYNAGHNFQGYLNSIPTEQQPAFRVYNAYQQGLKAIGDTSTNILNTLSTIPSSTAKLISPVVQPLQNAESAIVNLPGAGYNQLVNTAKSTTNLIDTSSKLINSGIDLYGNSLKNTVVSTIKTDYETAKYDTSKILKNVIGFGIGAANVIHKEEGELYGYGFPSETPPNSNKNKNPVVNEYENPLSNPNTNPNKNENPGEFITNLPEVFTYPTPTVNPFITSTGNPDIPSLPKIDLKLGNLLLPSFPSISLGGGVSGGGINKRKGRVHREIFSLGTLVIPTGKSKGSLGYKADMRPITTQKQPTKRPVKPTTQKQAPLKINMPQPVLYNKPQQKQSTRLRISVPAQPVRPMKAHVTIPRNYVPVTFNPVHTNNRIPMNNIPLNNMTIQKKGKKNNSTNLRSALY